MKTYALPEAATALWLADRAAEEGDTVFLVRGVARLERLATSCAGFCAGRVELVVLPPWDVLPYDRIGPSAGVIGRRIRALSQLAGPSGGVPRLFLASAGAALQRVPPPGRWAGVRTTFAVGDEVDPAAIRTTLREQGYHLCEAVSDAGDLAVHAHVIDIHPAGMPHPVRLSLDGTRVTAIHRLDPVTQRSLEDIDRVVAYPVLEHGGDEALVSVLDYVPGFRLLVDEGVEARWAELREHIADAYESRHQMRRAGAEVGAGAGPLPPPDRLYLSEAETAACLARGKPAKPGAKVEHAPQRVNDLVERIAATDLPMVIAAPGDPKRLARSLAKRGVTVRAATDWADAVSGGAACWTLDIDGGFRTKGLVVLQAAHLLRHEPATAASLLSGDHALKVGDIVVHAEHGTARLAGLKPFEVEGGRAERLALAFANQAELLVDPLELDRIWRYGTEGALDHIGGESWRSRREEIEAEIQAVAGELTARAEARAKRRAPVMAPDRAQYERLALRFPHPLSADQRTAVGAVLADLRRGSPMNRLVCGDVGFGKTEVALRAAAAAALSGYQVAVVAPTTVLARQHLDTFRRRFAGTKIRVEALMGGADTRSVRKGLADGRIGIVVGTQGLATEARGFKRLGLVIIDEEQRLGEADKQALTGHETAEGAVHALVMTATPIPRTMQMAMVGLREVSVIATPPANRQSPRTMILPFDPEMLRDVLLREQARGGQSFIVSPRIADLAPLAEELAALAPGLHVVQAHGRMKPEALEQAVVGFAAGEGDVLLATNIIEAGLDIPRANVIFVMHPDRFGLAQLHQMRGRVGRGARRGTAYLMTDPGRELPDSTLARLRALETFSHLGAGIALSGADLEQRGAGELFGSAQAGHVSALGTELYHHLLLRAVRARQGAAHPPPAPVLHVGLHGRIPEDYVHDVDLRVALYRRLARFEDADAVDAFTEELTDRFGPPPAETEALLTLARLRCIGGRARVKHLESGPRGVSIALHEGETPLELAQQLSVLAERLGGVIRADRLVVPLDHAPPHRRVGELIGLLGHA